VAGGRLDSGFEFGHEFVVAQALLDGGKEFDHREAGFAHDAASAPEDSDIGCGGNDLLTGLPIENGSSDLVGTMRTCRDAGALGKDDKLSGKPRPGVHVPDHLADCLASLAAVDRDGSDPPGEVSDDGRAQKFLLHDEFRAGRDAYDQDDVQKALMLGGDDDLSVWRIAADFRAQSNHPASAQADPAAIGADPAKGPGAIEERERDEEERHECHHQVHLHVEQQREHPLYRVSDHADPSRMLGVTGGIDCGHRRLCLNGRRPSVAAAFRSPQIGVENM